MLASIARGTLCGVTGGEWLVGDKSLKRIKATPTRLVNNLTH